MPNSAISSQLYPVAISTAVFASRRHLALLLVGFSVGLSKDGNGVGTCDGSADGLAHPWWHEMGHLSSNMSGQ